MSNLKVGDKVFVTPEHNNVWTGNADVARILKPSMKIVSVKRSTQKTGLKVYGKVEGESGKTYNFAYLRRDGFRGWICSCDNFFFEQLAKRRNCKHLKFVRKQVGRFATSVPKA